MFGRRFFEFERHSRLFEKGDLKYVILDLLKDKPRHGYEIIRALEESFHGFYSPSAGSVYPTLQLLDDMGYLKAAERDGKKVYTITDEGNNFLAERGETIVKIKGQMRDWWGTGNREEMRKTVQEFRELVFSLKGKFFQLDDVKMAKIREIIARTRVEIEAVLKE